MPRTRTFLSRLFDSDPDGYWDDPSETRPRRRILPLFTIANFLSLLLIYIAERYIAERSWFVAFITYIPQQPYIIPTLLLTIWSLGRKEWKMAVLNALTALFCIVALLGFNIPSGAVHAEPGKSIRVMTYNLRQGEFGSRKIANVISRCKPDIVCLQEAYQDGQWGDPVQEIPRKLPGWHMARFGEIATLSRYPIIRQSICQGPKPILETQLRIRGRELMVFNTHFFIEQLYEAVENNSDRLPESVKRSAHMLDSQSSALLQAADNIRGPLIICGDFNMPHGDSNFHRIASRYPDSFNTAGWGFGSTFRSDIPVLRIDHIFLNSAVKVSRCYVPGVIASDHRPVVADIAIR